MASITNPLRLSVIINNYNYSQYIEECIQSTLKQTRPADEIIFVDDGSTDNSLEIVERYRDHVKIISQPNGGQLSAVMTGTDASTGDILLYLDSDDIWKDIHLETVENTFKSAPGLGCLFTSLELFGSETGPHRKNKLKHPSKLNESKLITYYLDQFLGRPTSSGAFRSAPMKQVLAACRGIESDFKVCADKVLSQGASLIGMSKLFIDDCTVRYRTHDSNAFYNADRRTEEEKQLKYRNNLICSRIQLNYPFNKDTNALIREIKKNQNAQLFKLYYRRVPKRMQLSEISKALLKYRLRIITCRLDN